MAFGVKTANIYDLLDDNGDENVPVEAAPSKQASAKSKESDKPGEASQAWAHMRIKWTM